MRGERLIRVFLFFCLDRISFALYIGIKATETAETQRKDRPMGTSIFTTDKPAGAVLTDELCGEGCAIRMFEIDGAAAAVALSVDLTKISEAWRAFSLATYDLPANASRAIVGVVVKHEGLNGRGRRSVAVKVMDECVGPYYTGGASKQLLNILSPLRPNAADAQEGRERAYAAAR